MIISSRAGKVLIANAALNSLITLTGMQNDMEQ